jgi:hypothetical protein
MNSIRGKPSDSAPGRGESAMSVRTLPGVVPWSGIDCGLDQRPIRSNLHCSSKNIRWSRCGCLRGAIDRKHKRPNEHQVPPGSSLENTQFEELYGKIPFVTTVPRHIQTHPKLMNPLPMSPQSEVAKLSLVTEISYREPELPSAISYHGVQSDLPSKRRKQRNPQNRV